MECDRKANAQSCTGTYEPCPRRGICVSRSAESPVLCPNSQK